MTVQRKHFTLLILIFLAVCHAIFAPEATAGAIPISTAEELAKIGTDPSYLLTGHYELTSDIDLSGYSNWAPIGTSSLNAFTGTFDGNGHTISNLTITGNGITVGLFGWMAGTVGSVDLTNVNVSGYDGTAGLAGYNYGGSITNSTVSGSVLNTGGALTLTAGGLAGNNTGSITDSAATCSVSSRGFGAGGLVGNNNGGSITNSAASGSVSGNISIGGLVGNNSGTITNSAATGRVSGVLYVGGFAGSNSGAITNSAATGNVSGRDNTGGLVGYNNLTGAITNSAATGNVSGDQRIGGLVGYNNLTGAITNSAATGRVSGNTATTGGFVGQNNNTSTVADSVFDRQGTGRTVGIGSNLNLGSATTTPLLTTDMTVPSSSLPTVFADDVNWTLVPGYYPQPAALTDVSLVSPRVKAISALSAVPVFLDAANTSDPDTSANVRKMFYAPSRDADGAKIDWSEASGVLKFSASGDVVDVGWLPVATSTDVYLEATVGNITKTFYLTIAANTSAGYPPTITSPNSMSFVRDGNLRTFQVKATAFAPISYSISSDGSDGITINPSTGVITISEATAAGTYVFTITVSGSIGTDARQTFTLKVTETLPPPATPTSISPMKLWVTRARYDGKPHSPVFLLINLAEKEMLREGTDYDAAGRGTWTEAGSYLITAAGKGKYTDTKTAWFVISKRPENADPAASALSLANSVNSGGFGLYAVPDGATVTITNEGEAPVLSGELNLETVPGVTIIWQASLTGSSPGRLVSVNGGGDIKISGGSIINEADGGTALYCEGDASMESGTVSANGYAASAVDADGKFTLSGGAVTAGGKYGTGIFAAQGVTVTGGKVFAGQGGAAVLSLSDLNSAGGGNNGPSNTGGVSNSASGGGGCDAGAPGVIAFLAAAAVIIRRKQ